MTLVTNFPHGIRAIWVEDEKSEEEGTQNSGGLKFPTLIPNLPCVRQNLYF